MQPKVCFFRWNFIFLKFGGSKSKFAPICSPFSIEQNPKREQKEGAAKICSPFSYLNGRSRKSLLVRLSQKWRSSKYRYTVLPQPLLVRGLAACQAGRLFSLAEMTYPVILPPVKPAYGLETICDPSGCGADLRHGCCWCFEAKLVEENTILTPDVW